MGRNYLLANAIDLRLLLFGQLCTFENRAGCISKRNELLLEFSDLCPQVFVLNRFDSILDSTEAVTCG
jgi:hypothetical protein